MPLNAIIYNTLCYWPATAFYIDICTYMIQYFDSFYANFERAVTQLQNPVSTVPNDFSCYKFHFLCVLTPLQTHQRLGHHHLNLLLGQHSKLSKQTLYDKLPGLQLRVNGDAWHGGNALLLPREGSHWGGGTASTHAATDWCGSCGEGEKKKRVGNNIVSTKRTWSK